MSEKPSQTQIQARKELERRRLARAKASRRARSGCMKNKDDSHAAEAAEKMAQLLLQEEEEERARSLSAPKDSPEQMDRMQTRSRSMST
mmetsp:Transcript_38596/g.60214  ORF Transcript_38596/g.60214 Transcript_38596/m.60214 type:complete len:89 (-) Transcript_38596:1024-1290(-)